MGSAMDFLDGFNILLSKQIICHHPKCKSHFKCLLICDGKDKFAVAQN